MFPSGCLNVALRLPLGCPYIALRLSSGCPGGCPVVAIWLSEVALRLPSFMAENIPGYEQKYPIAPFLTKALNARNS